MKIKKYLNYLKKFWNYLWHDDSLGSYILNFLVAFIVIKYLFFPTIGLILNNDYPVVAIVSGSMQHKIVNNLVCDKYIADVSKKNLDFNSWWDLCGNYYSKFLNISYTDFKNFEYTNGLNIGDVMILYGKNPKNIKVGEVLVFIPQNKIFFLEKGPVIHRVIKKWIDDKGVIHFRTKGDHNPQTIQNFENDITQNNVIGVAVLRVPFIGYAKLALNNIFIGISNLYR